MVNLLHIYRQDLLKSFLESSASTQATSVDKSITGVAAGGDIDRDTILAKGFLGFEGSPSELEGFLASNPGASSRMNMYRSAMANQNPNVVPNEANIAGQPHRLAYVNPQEEKLLRSCRRCRTTFLWWHYQLII